ncbi:DUF7002 family protein [Tardiphaga alba]|nr:hypothetical protein [Tardiphaga alba]
MNEADLTNNFPRLWHMAEAGSWESIKKHGLLSATALLDLYKVTGMARTAIESERRPESVKVTADGLEGAIIRDNKPMTASALEKCLDPDITPKEWFELLNDRSFFWLSRDRLRTLLGAKAYRGRPQTVLTVDTQSLLKAHRETVQLSPINSGATLYNPQPRGRNTFSSIADYPFEEWRKKRNLANSIVELVVPGGVKDIADHVVAVHSFEKGVSTELWRRPGSSPDDGP